MSKTTIFETTLWQATSFASLFGDVSTRVHTRGLSISDAMISFYTVLHLRSYPMAIDGGKSRFGALEATCQTQILDEFIEHTVSQGYKGVNDGGNEEAGVTITIYEMMQPVFTSGKLFERGGNLRHEAGKKFSNTLMSCIGF
ncbi:hypothetical protein J7T55_004119 [Diaporthe amygdali]|uniref:uncharacterized protein n=1 Tax=Phomopsis amygdali TaxID=1214568 RepID=UPI0022FE136F|nr:uncharacterized protein J7T55_004119 [Diaporthe amygdali]KAJ0115949.1 hypothetical protein J7T55_004119 [Diaporthe amygdali]